LLRFRTLVVVAALGAALTVAASAGAVVPKLTGTVGPGFTITLKRGTAPVRLLKAGTYSITVADKSNIHNFRIKGPGLNREITSVPFVGTKTVTLRLREGKYMFVCDPHATIMKGSFTVS
jgi:plastocyanin